jgi:DNA uptake protein ComE-like DNA-binding protein
MNSDQKFRFGFTKGDRNGIFVFSLILIVGIAINYFSINSLSNSEHTRLVSSAEDSLQQLIDSLKYRQSLDNQKTIYPFNPNFITDYKGYTLEMTTAEIDRLLEFRAKDQWINSKAQFQKVTKVSDKWMSNYSQYFKFPDWVIEAESRRAKESKSKRKLSIAEKKDLNSISQEDLQKVEGIGPVLSERIIKYRAKLGGFVDMIQLKDVYGLKPEVIEALSKTVALKSPVEVEKKDINTIQVVELIELPYFDYELAREVVNFINLRQGIKSFEELSKINDFPTYKLDRIQLYLEIKE